MALTSPADAGSVAAMDTRIANLPDGTYDRTTLAPVTPAAGYAVGGNDDHTPYVGVWTDTLTGKVWVDNVVIVDDRAAALELAARNGELAIWSFAESKEVRL